MNEAGGSIITRGVNFSSVCDFLFFMSGDEAGSEDTEDISEKKGGRVSMYPVVKLKRLSFKNWLQVGKGSWKRIGGPSDVRAKVNVQGQKGLQGSLLKRTLKCRKTCRIVVKTWWTNMPVTRAATTSACSVSTPLERGLA